MYTLEDIKEEVDRCIEILIEMGGDIFIPTKVTISNRLKKSLGICYKKGFIYKIVINGNYLRNTSCRNIHNIIMHECIHCVKGCFNHNKEWRKMADLINKKYTQYSISRIVKDEEYDAFYDSTAKFKYEIFCEGCGKSNGKYKVNSKSIKSINNQEHCYHCGFCGSTNLIVKTLN